MPDTYTTTLGAILMAIGGDNNTWGTNLNNSVIQILEDAIANALPGATASVTGGTLDLSQNAPPAGPSAARYAFLPFTGTLTSNQIVKVPNLTKSWLVRNGTSGAFTLSIETTSGTPQTIPQNGGWQLVTCDGANNILVWPFNTAQVAMPNGTAAAPAFSFVNESNSGWYRSGTQDIRLAIAGADVLQVTGPAASTPSVVNILNPNSLEVAGAQAGFATTGDVKLTFKTVADPGWVMMNDSTMGDASSNATYANANCSALWQLLYNNIADADAPILTSGGAATTRGAQGSAATAFANHCRLTLPLVLGRALAGAGAGAGLTSRALGHATGEETHTLSTGEIPAHTHGYSGTTGGESATHTHQIQQSSTATFGAGSFAGASQPTTVNTSTESQGHTHSYSGTTDNGGLGGGAHNTMQPTTFLNVMIKL
ncbi:MAG: hypothetical protein JO328_21370 [Hyphomicrobiales bacterium]|nr:hypothetical protein [Hyphomicrobiales bacterium]MBV9429117.1 hypothetical protein [Bradyrhizobiaceae bacterium]